MVQSIFSEVDRLQLPTMDVFVGVLRKFSKQLFTRKTNSGQLSLKQAQFLK